MNPIDIKIFIYLIFLILNIAVLISMFRAYFSAAPACPTRKKDWDRIIEISGIKKGEVVYDFGSGTGGVGGYISKKTGARVIGLEMSWPFYLYSKFVNILKGNKNFTVKSADFFEYNISDADYVFCFLTPRAMEKLGDKFKKELPVGAKVVSRAFKIPNWEPVVVSRDENGKAPIYVYQK